MKRPSLSILTSLSISVTCQWLRPIIKYPCVRSPLLSSGESSSTCEMKFEMTYFRSYWSHLDISTTICSNQMAAVKLELMTLGF